MNVLEAIQRKRAVRQFKPDPLPDEVVRAILNAGRRAQSAKNLQRWRFIAVTDKGLLEKLSTTGQYAGHLKGAELGVFILTTDPGESFTVAFDAGQCAAYMQLAAWELGVGSVLATIYEHERAREMLCFPAEWHLRIALSFGYPADPESLTRPNKPGGREPFEQVVHWNTWEGRPCE